MSANNDEGSQVLFHSWSLNDNAQDLVKGSPLPNVNFHSIKYSDKSLYIWIGDSGCKLENMSCSMKTPYEKEPLGIDLLLATTEEQNDKSDISKDLSIKLAKRLNKQIVVSFNVAAKLLDQFSLQSQPIDFVAQSPTKCDLNNNNFTLMQLIEKRLYGEIKANPEKF